MTATTTKQIPAQRTTRRPTGIPSWPILLLAGGEKAGKSWACAQASASDLVGRTLWVGIGEDDPDEYGPDPVTGKGGVPGARFEIVPHDGTYRDILAAIDWAAAEPQVDGKPTLIVVDSMTRLWNLLCDMGQDAADRRAVAKARKEKRPVSEEPADIHMDLWNQAKDRWGHVMDALRAHKGPVLVTARLDEVTVMRGGKPTTEKTLKVQAEKNLPYDVGGIIQMPERGKAYLTGVRTTRMQIPERLILPGFTVDKLWRDLGLADGADRGRSHASVDRSNQDPISTQRRLLLEEIRRLVSGDLPELKRIAQEWAAAHDGDDIAATTDIGGLELVRDDVALRSAQTERSVSAA